MLYFCRLTNRDTMKLALKGAWVFGLMCLSSVVLAQSNMTWVEMMHDPTFTVEEVRQAYNQQWASIPYERGQGHKQFQRWAYFMEERVGPHGKRPDPGIAWKEMARLNKNQSRGGFQGDWKPMGPSDWVNHTSGYNPGLGRVNWVELDPINPQTIYLTTPSGGFWRSPNQGATWENLTDHLPVIGATGFAINPQNNQTLLLGTGDGYGASTYSIGLLKSHDAGYTWDTTGLQWNVPDFVRISDVQYAPNDTNVIMVGTSNGVYRSVDGGDNWSHVIPAGNFRTMQYHPLNPNVLYVASNRIYKSDDGGATFREITDGVPSANGTSRIALGMSPADSLRVYALIASSSTQGLRGFYRSDDAGESFVLKLDTPNILASDVNGARANGQGWYDLCIAVSPVNADHVFTGGVNIWRTFNGGDSFSLMSHWRYDNNNDPYVHADIHYLGYHGNALYVGCDGGIFRTNTGGLSWQDLSEGLEITQVYGIGLSPNFNNIMQFGSQDNGTNRLEGGTWKHIFGADGMHTIIHPTNPNIVYITTQFGNLRKSIDGGATFMRLMSNIQESGLWVTPYVMHPNDPNTLLVGKDNIWKTTDGGMTWNMLRDGGNTKIRHIAQSKTNPDIIYYSNGSRPWKTEDGGDTWTMVRPGLPNNLTVSHIEVSPNDEDIVYVSFSGYSRNQRIFRSTDRGETWQDISEGLPALPANVIAVQSGEKDRLYLGMDIGVYYLEDGMTEWMPFFDGMPNVIVNDLKIQYNIGTIRAGTYGRGIWESELFHVNIGTDAFDLSRETVKIYPNPASDYIHIDAKLNGKAELVSLSGQAIRTFNINKGQLHRIDVRDVTPGAYVIRIKTEDGVLSHKCILQ